MPRSRSMVAGVDHALGDLLVGAECAGLLQHLVHQGGLAVVNVGDDRNIAQIFLDHIRYLFKLSKSGVWCTNISCGRG